MEETACTQLLEWILELEAGNCWSEIIKLLLLGWKLLDATQSLKDEALKKAKIRTQRKNDSCILTLVKSVEISTFLRLPLADGKLRNILVATANWGSKVL